VSSSNVNGAAWWIGWRPKPVIIGGAIIGLILGIVADALVPLLFGGLVVGLGVYYWGTTEINNKYVTLRNSFKERARSSAEDKAGLTASDYSESYSLFVRKGRSPPFVKPSQQYGASFAFLTDISLNLDTGNVYDMKSRKETKSGSQREVYYDNMEDVKTNDRGGYTEIILKMSAGDDVSFSSGDQTEAEAVQRDLRNKIREVKREQRQ